VEALGGGRDYIFLSSLTSLFFPRQTEINILRRHIKALVKYLPVVPTDGLYLIGLGRTIGNSPE
jgi:hypothetical protein